MDSSDVIEIGEDGTFEIPITQSAKASSSKADKLTPQIFSIAEPKPADLSVNNTFALSALGPGEFKVFRNKAAGTIYALIRLRDNELLSVLKISQNAILIDLNCNKQLEIPLPCLVNSKTAISKSFDKYLTVEMTCI